MNIEVTPVLQLLIEVLALFVSTLVLLEIAPRVRAFFEPFREKWPVEANFLEAQAALAVDAAEEYLHGPGRGEEKLKYALAYVEGQAKKYGFSFDEDAINVLIHAKVKELHDKILAGTPAKK